MARSIEVIDDDHDVVDDDDDNDDDNDNNNNNNNNNCKGVRLPSTKYTHYLQFFYLIVPLIFNFI